VVVVVRKEKGLQEVGGNFVQDDMEQSRWEESLKESEANCREEHMTVGE